MILDTVKLSDIGRVVTGKTPPTKNPEYYGEDHPFITPTDISDTSSAFLPTRYISGLGREKYRNSMLPADSVCYTCIASVGKMCMTDRLSLTNQQINSIVVDKVKFDPRYVYYRLRIATPYIVGIAGGVATPIINKSMFSDIELTVSPLPIQRKIAAILSAYDDLIENNERRIKILEEMAQNLYREWFVKFRFPLLRSDGSYAGQAGHKKVKMVNSPLGKIPEGWEVKKLGELLSDLESGKRPKGGASERGKNGVPSIGAENIKGIGRHDFASEKFVPRTFFEKMRTGQIRDGDVALYKDGAYIGRSSYFRDGFPHTECCVNEHVFLLRPSSEIGCNFLHLWLTQDSTVAALRSTNANAAQPGINQKGVLGMSLMLPSKDILKATNDVLKPLYGEVISLAKRNRLLRQTRDLLLPRLISGEVDVSELDIKIPETLK